MWFNLQQCLQILILATCLISIMPETLCSNHKCFIVHLGLFQYLVCWLRVVRGVFRFHENKFNDSRLQPWGLGLGAVQQQQASSVKPLLWLGLEVVSTGVPASPLGLHAQLLLQCRTCPWVCCFEPCVFLLCNHNFAAAFVGNC
jgi:hypothetical protein